MTYVYAFDHPHTGPLGDIKAIIGGKAANITVMAGDLGLPVPPGFTISTDACRAFLTQGWPRGLEDEIREHMRRLEQEVGRRFGGPVDPLLVSVRSGAPVSMPGMMDTVLNLGLNDVTAQGLASLSGDRAFAEACRARFLEMYQDIVGVAVVPDDPWDQLRGAIEAVFRSWNNDRARAYRAREGISEDLGTAVTVQAMVFGNWGEDSASGVLFTRNPATGDPSLYGEVVFRAQGEDVVAGTDHAEPFAALTLELPSVAADLRRHAHVLERYYADVCDIEFTVERGRLWLLQVRIARRSPQAALRVAVDMAEDPDFPLSRAEAVSRVAALLGAPPQISVRSADALAVATGLPASPGLASGEIVTTPEAAIAVADTGRRVILVRTETSPDDVHGMARATGILTSTGGLTCHAAVVARGWGIPAVVGAEEVRLDDGTVRIGDRTFAVGETLTIDGSSGEVFAGEIVGTNSTLPEVETLLGWADELGIEIPPHKKETTGPERLTTAEAAGKRTIDEVVRALLIKGFATPDQMADALQTSPAEAGSILERAAAERLAEVAGGLFRLTREGQALGQGLVAEDSRRWGLENAQNGLDAFLPIDERIKEVVTRWQMRELEGQHVMNDHSDPAYDMSVLADLASVHEDAVAWLRPLTDELPRLEAYLARLERAARGISDGDHAYIASPMVDSYHSIWFELHEELILLAGRSREGEVAAGRA